MGEVVASSTMVLIRNRWPSGETTYSCANGPTDWFAAPTRVTNSGTGLPISTVWPLEASLDRRRHQPIIQPDVKQFLPVAPPAHLRAAIRRDLPFASWPGKRLHIDLEASRFVRLVREPLSVRRKLPFAFFELGTDQSKWPPIPT